MRSIRQNLARMLALLMAALLVASPALAAPCPMARDASQQSGDVSPDIKPRSGCCGETNVVGHDAGQSDLQTTDTESSRPDRSPDKHKTCNQCVQCCCAPNVSDLPMAITCLDPTSQRGWHPSALLPADSAALDGVFQPPRS